YSFVPEIFLCFLLQTPCCEPMDLLKTVTEALTGQLPRPRLSDGSVVVPTHCVYPSGGLVTVSVEGGEDTFVVTDRAGAIEVLEGAGGHSIPRASKIIDSLSRRYGLRSNKRGVVLASNTRLNSLAATIVLVANASQD